MDMSDRGPSTVKEPETKRLKVDNNSKSKVSEIITTNAAQRFHGCWLEFESSIIEL